MKICVTSQGENLDFSIDSRFGRCEYFIFINSDTLEHKSIKNPNIDSAGGAGIQSGQMMSEEGVKVVLTGNMGPNAFNILKSAKIQVITNLSGTVKEAINKFKKGELKPSKNPSVGSKFGMGNE